MTPDERRLNCAYAHKVVAENAPMTPEERVKIVALLRTVRVATLLRGRHDAA